MTIRSFECMRPIFESIRRPIAVNPSVESTIELLSQSLFTSNGNPIVQFFFSNSLPFRSIHSDPRDLLSGEVFGLICVKDLGILVCQRIGMIST